MPLQLGPFVLEQPVARGGMGAVWRASRPTVRARELALGAARLIPRVGASLVLAVTAAQARRDEHGWHAEEVLGATATLAYVDDDFVQLAEACARASGLALAGRAVGGVRRGGPREARVTRDTRVAAVPDARRCPAVARAATLRG